MERPILFSAPMVRAILAGTKSQTRRPLYVVTKTFERAIMEDYGRGEYPNVPPGHAWTLSQWRHVKTGDRLWVKETHAPLTIGYAYRADPIYNASPAGRWTPSIFMPRAASRITLEVTGVRVERLQDISEADAIAEGVHADVSGRQDDDGAAFHRIGPIRGDSFPIARYAALWESINGPGSWAANQWVWVIEFKMDDF